MTGGPRLNLHDWAAAAEEIADAAAWEYLIRGSGANVTATENVAAWSRWALLPHVLRDVSAVDLSTTVLGTRIATPILVAPTAIHRFFTDDGELATARAAAEVGTVFVVSMAATHSVEAVAEAAPDGARWAQMYMLRDRGRTQSLAERAAAAGYSAIVASVDGAAVGRGIASASAGRLTPTSTPHRRASLFRGVGRPGSPPSARLPAPSRTTRRSHEPSRVRAR